MNRRKFADATTAILLGLSLSLCASGIANASSGEPRPFPPKCQSEYKTTTKDCLILY